MNKPIFQFQSLNVEKMNKLLLLINCVASNKFYNHTVKIPLISGNLSSSAMPSRFGKSANTSWTHHGSYALLHVKVLANR